MIRVAMLRDIMDNKEMDATQLDNILANYSDNFLDIEALAGEMLAVGSYSTSEHRVPALGMDSLSCLI